MNIQCKECTKHFELSQNEIDFFKSKNLHLPKRCKDCRKKNSHKRKQYHKNKRKNTQKTNIKLALYAFIALFIFVFSFFAHFFEDKNLSHSPSYQSEVEFRNTNLLNDHFHKHGIDMGFSNAKEYEKRAKEIIRNPQALKRQQDDSDMAYFLPPTGEFVVVSYDGFIRTFFKPNDGILYFNKQ